MLEFSCVIFCRELVEVGHSSKDSGRQLFAGTDAKPAIVFPPPVTAQWEEQVRIFRTTQNNLSNLFFRNNPMLAISMKDDTFFG